MSVPTKLYRHFDTAGTLLYVGISNSAVARLGQHEKDKLWHDDIASMTIETFGTRKEAEQAERDAIRAEKPLHNKVQYRTLPSAPKKPKDLKFHSTITIAPSGDWVSTSFPIGSNANAYRAWQVFTAATPIDYHWQGKESIVWMEAVEYCRRAGQWYAHEDHAFAHMAWDLHALNNVIVSVPGKIGGWRIVTTVHESPDELLAGVVWTADDSNSTPWAHLRKDWLIA
jgi:hypothetical protein